MYNIVRKIYIQRLGQSENTTNNNTTNNNNNYNNRGIYSELKLANNGQKRVDGETL